MFSVRLTGGITIKKKKKTLVSTISLKPLHTYDCKLAFYFVFPCDRAITVYVYAHLFLGVTIGVRVLACLKTVV